MSLLGPGWRDRLAPAPATLAYCERLREVCFTWPAGFIAHHYTRYLGDLSGGRIVARALVRRYGLDRHSTAFYDFPSLGSPAAFKRGYRAKLDALPYPPSELDALVAETRLAFRHNRRVFEDLSRSYPGWRRWPTRDPVMVAAGATAGSR